MTENKPLIVLIGPTAVGKTSASLALAERFAGEIISADSRLVYRGMDIGTAKPTPAERRRVPHHLVDLCEPSETFSLALYGELASEAIESCHARGVLPFLVGGTGQFIRGVVEGWQPPPAQDQAFRRELEAMAEAKGAEALHQRLAAVDPARAAAIDPRNVRRVVRALEIHHVTGDRPSELRQKQPPPYRILTLGLRLPRQILYERIDQRLQHMLKHGWPEEVRTLLERGVSLDAPAMSAIGYRELAAVLGGELTLAEAEVAIRRSSRQFVRRQANWFKPDDGSITWFDSQDGVVERMSEVIQAWLER